MKSILTTCILMLTLCILITSCKKDPETVSGCTDLQGDNYNAEASVDNGSCTFQKRYLGEYTGTLSCQGLLAFVFSTADVSITELVKKDEVNVIIQTSIGPTPVHGKISRDTLSVNDELKNLKIKPSALFPGTSDVEVSFNIAVISKLLISTDNKTLTGNIFISLTPLEDIVTPFITFKANTPIPDNCGFVGTRK